MAIYLIMFDAKNIYAQTQNGINKFCAIACSFNRFPNGIDENF